MVTKRRQGNRAPSSFSDATNSSAGSAVVDRSSSLAAATECELLELIVGNSTVATFVVDEQHRCLFLNPAAEKLVGFSIRELKGQNLEAISTCFCLADEPSTRLSAAAYPGSVAQRRESFCVHRDGRRIPVNYVATVLQKGGRAAGAVVEIYDASHRTQSEERFRRILQHADSGIALADLDGRFIQCNRAYAELMGCTEEEIVLKDFASLMLVDSGDDEHKKLKKLLRGEVTSFEIETLGGCREGAHSWTRHTVSLLSDEQGSPMSLLVFARDVTEQKKTEESLRRSEAWLAAVLETLPVSVIIADREGKIVLMNQKSREIWGPAPMSENIAGYKEWIGFWPESGRIIESHEWPLSRAVLHGETTFNQLVEIERFDSNERAFLELSACPIANDNGDVIGGVVACLDVTKRHLAEQAARESEAHVSRVLDNLFAFVGVLTLDGTLIQANRAPVEAAGITLDDVTDRKFWDCYWWSYSPEVQERLKDAIKRAVGGEVVRYDVPVRMANDSRMWIDFQLAPLRDARGRVTHLIPSAMDITDRREAEEAVRNSEATLSAVLDALPVGVVIADPSGKLIRDNAANRELWGVPPRTENWEEYGQWIAYWPDDGNRIEAHEWAMARALLHGEVVTNELVECERFDTRERRLFLNNAAPVRDQEGRVIGGVVAELDVTERVASERAAAEARRRLDAALIAGEVGAFEWDIVNDRLRGDANFARIFGVTLDATGAAPLAEYLAAIHPDDRRSVAEAIQRTVATGEDYEREYRIVTCGKTRWVVARGKVERDAESGKALRFPGVVLDITERKRAEAALKESEGLLARQQRLYQGILDNTPDLAYVFDPQHRFIYANQGLLTTWGKSWDEAIGKTCLELGYEPWHAEMHDREIDHVIATKQAIRGEVPFSGVHGLRIYDYIFVPVFGADGEVEAVAGTTRDVTELRHVAEEREALLERERAARSEVERVSHMKDEFLATLSHELRTPLNAILGWAHIISRTKLDPEAMQKAVEVITRNAKAQAQLIEDLLDMSRVVSGKIQLDVQTVEVRELLESAVGAVKHAAEAKQIRILKETAPNVGRLRGDPNRLQQVLWNLLTNAVKFTPQGGEVRISVLREQDTIRIRVSDTGLGIKPEFLPHLFERFRQADSSTTRRHGGLGLGLSIVKSLVELHGGVVQAFSEGEGRGATFTVDLPRAVGSLGDEESPSWHHPTPPSIDERACTALVGKRVLVVDDEADARVLLDQIFRDRGAVVTAVDSAAEALRALRSSRFDVIISDIGMPNEDGYSLIRKVRSLRREEGAHTPAIALTAFAREEDRQQALRSGYQTHVAKPMDATQLLSVVTELVAPA